ncbi:MAG TPA: hypothetical protein VGL71_03790, partial [Urbifossiella sp.]
MRFALMACSRFGIGLVLAFAVVMSAETNLLPGQPPAKEAAKAAPKNGELPPLNQAVIDESIARGIEFLKVTQKDDGTWDDGAGHIVGCTALTSVALIENGVRLSDSAIIKAAAYIRSKASSLNDTYQISLTILFLDRLKDPKRDDAMIHTLAARLMGGQTATGGWTYVVSGDPQKRPKMSEADAVQMIAALKKMTPPPATVSVSYRERPSRLGLCIKQSEDIIVKPSKAAIDASEYEKKRESILKTLSPSLKTRVVFQDPEKYAKIPPEEKNAFLAKEKGDNSNTHFAMV